MIQRWANQVSEQRTWSVFHLLGTLPYNLSQSSFPQGMRFHSFNHLLLALVKGKGVQAKVGI